MVRLYQPLAKTPKHTGKKVWAIVLALIVVCTTSVVIKIQFFTPKPVPAKRESTHNNQQTNNPQSALTPPKPSGLTVPSSFTLEQKIGQLLVVGVSDKDMAVSLEKTYQLGGFLLMTNSNMFNKVATDEVKQAGSLIPIIAVDQEGGYVSRLPDQTFRSYTARYMGTLPSDQVQGIGSQMGQSLAAIGANVDFAPVLDLDDGQNAAISYWHRSFSSDPAIVSQKASAFAAGLRAAGVVPTFKHFPGLGYATGATNGDTDIGPATTPPFATLQQRDLLPYKIIQTSDVSTVMVGNQTVPGLTNGLPASLSGTAYDYLRKTYNFQQVTFTDEIAGAKAITQVEPTPTQAVIDALSAGVDMPLINISSEQEIADIIAGVSQAVQANELSPQRITDALNRIMILKTWITKHST
jgi:beta-N-acetylhexosaminidase